MSPELLGHCGAEASSCPSPPKAALRVSGKCLGLGSPRQGLQVVGWASQGLNGDGERRHPRFLGGGDQGPGEGPKGPRGWAPVSPGWLK